MTWAQFIKKLVSLDVFWGRRSKIHHGCKDGGVKALAINDGDIAKKHDDSTIYNVNHPDNECQGGHYHDVFDLGILTHNRNNAGTRLMTYEPASNTHILGGSHVVVNNQGEVVRYGKSKVNG